MHCSDPTPHWYPWITTHIVLATCAYGWSVTRPAERALSMLTQQHDRSPGPLSAKRAQYQWVWTSRGIRVGANDRTRFWPRNLVPGHQKFWGHQLQIFGFGSKPYVENIHLNIYGVYFVKKRGYKQIIIIISRSRNFRKICISRQEMKIFGFLSFTIQNLIKSPFLHIFFCKIVFTLL